MEGKCEGKKNKIVREFMWFCEFWKSFLDREETVRNLGTKVIWKPQEIKLWSWERKEDLFIKIGFTRFPRINCFFKSSVLWTCEKTLKVTKDRQNILCDRGIWQKWFNLGKSGSLPKMDEGKLSIHSRRSQLIPWTNGALHKISYWPRISVC